MSKTWGSFRILVAVALFGVVIFCLPKSISKPFTPLTHISDVIEMSNRNVSRKITIQFLGDVMAHDTQITGAKTGNGDYDFNASFDYIRKYLQRADLVIANLETTLAGPAQGYHGYPQFRAPDALAQALKNVGVDVLVHANNHSLDAGLEGLIRTSETIQSLGMRVAGTRMSRTEDTISYLNSEGFDIAIISGTYGTNGLTLPKEHAYMLNDLDETRLVDDVVRASKISDLVLCYLHFGTEYSEQPNQAQKSLAESLVNAGAHAVIGSHPHVVQTDGFIDQSVVVYSLGNLISAQRGAKRRTGMVYTITFVQNLINGSISIDHLEYLPVFTYKSNKGNRPYYLGPVAKKLEKFKHDSFESTDQALVDVGLDYLNRTVQHAQSQSTYGY